MYDANAKLCKRVILYEFTLPKHVQPVVYLQATGYISQEKFLCNASKEKCSSAITPPAGGLHVKTYLTNSKCKHILQYNASLDSKYVQYKHVARNNNCSSKCDQRVFKFQSCYHLKTTNTALPFYFTLMQI